MEQATISSTDLNWWLFTLPAVLTTDSLFSFLALFLAAFLSATLITWVFSTAGPAWPISRSHRGAVPIPGTRGLPLLGSLLTLSHGLPHRALAALSRSSAATHLMAFSIGNTPAVVASDPAIAKEILSHPSFADRPIKSSARELMFSRAIGFAPSGAYWRQLRRIASTNLFSPRRVAAHEPGRQSDCATMINNLAAEQRDTGMVRLRRHLQAAALNNIMGSVFGRRYDMASAEAAELQALVREGFELLGAFNWSDHLPWLASIYDPSHVKDRCASLVPRVRKLVKGCIDEHKSAVRSGAGDNGDFVDVLLSLDGDEKLGEDDMIAVLWEMIFRGTDTTALLTEWTMAELILHPLVQSRLRAEIDSAVGGNCTPTDADVAKLPYLAAVIKEALRAHPPGPLLSWARLSTSDVELSNGMVVPTGTTAMVNMWAITHDAAIWASPEEFKPERFVAAEGGVEGRLEEPELFVS